MMSPREYYALSDVQQVPVRLWAETQALMINLQLREGAEPFTAEDFLGTGNRAAREYERMQGQRRAQQLQRELGMMRAGQNDPRVPEWAREAR